MSVALGAVLSAIAGVITGFLDAWLRDERGGTAAVLGRLVAGAVVAVISYGLFVAAGLVIGVLTFSTMPDPWPALLGVVIGCVAFIAVRAVHSTLTMRFGMPVRHDRSQPRSFDDLLEARARGGASTMWLLGVGAALLPFSYGINCIVTRHGELGTTLFPGTVDGAPAVALGVGWIGVGLFLHFHFFFGLHPDLQAHSRRGKTLALAVACAGLMIGYAWGIGDSALTLVDRAAS